MMNRSEIKPESSVSKDSSKG